MTRQTCQLLYFFASLSQNNHYLKCTIAPKPYPTEYHLFPSKASKLGCIWKNSYLLHQEAPSSLFWRAATYKIHYEIPFLISPEVLRSMYINSLGEQRREALLNKGSRPIALNGTNALDCSLISSAKNILSVWDAYKPDSGSLKVSIKHCTSSPNRGESNSILFR